MRGLSMDQLIKLMGNCAVSKMSISKIERGILKPSEQTLQAIAKACKVPISYFCAPLFNMAPIEFRFDHSTSVIHREQIKASIITAIESHISLHSYNLNSTPFLNPIAGTTVNNYPDMDQSAVLLRRSWEIGSQPIFSVYELLQNHGIHLIEADIEDEYIDGASTYVNETIPIIVINKHRCTTTERKRFTALHELGHLLFNILPLSEEAYTNYRQSLTPIKRLSSVKHPDAERLCHYFAGAMLLPENNLRRRIGEHRTNIGIEELISIRTTYGISISATIHRLHDLCMIDDVCYNHIYDTLITPNRLEEGLGKFPVKEVADGDELMKIKLEKELYNKK